MPGMKKGDKFNFSHTTSVQSVLLYPGKYSLEVWGAQGISGGAGGYSKGELTVRTPVTLYICVGGSGVNFNGGRATYYNHYGSGGATHIGYKNTTITGYSSDYKTQLLIVAGGGGGYGGNGAGGVGGGANMNGGNGGNIRGGGGGGTLTAGGAGGTNASAGSFGNGGSNTAGTRSGGAMGGGGLYGGGAGASDYSKHDDFDDSGGGGGSGYANTSILKNISGSSGARSGHGYATITCIWPARSIYTINCITDSMYDIDFTKNHTVEIESKITNGIKKFVRYKFDEEPAFGYIDNIQIIEHTPGHIKFITPALNPSENEYYNITVEALYTNERCNSNYYKNAIISDVFEFENLINQEE